jgi:hypothetical protein
MATQEAASPTSMARDVQLPRSDSECVLSNTTCVVSRGFKPRLFSFVPLRDLIPAIGSRKQEGHCLPQPALVRVR